LRGVSCAHRVAANITANAMAGRLLRLPRVAVIPMVSNSQNSDTPGAELRHSSDPLFGRIVTTKGARILLQPHDSAGAKAFVRIADHYGDGPERAALNNRTRFSAWATGSLLPAV